MDIPLWPREDQTPGISLLQLDLKEDYRIELSQPVLTTKMQSPQWKHEGQEAKKSASPFLSIYLGGGEEMKNL